ncbi:hypothetical protein [Sphaerospermopsis sp. FACHB-1194]|nr:hypothetical protein [Sphaerospermopsis sp. FACHB-1194]MBD2147270.1 hypothetical protein [Sphaerospermopsis sp. FACHB-1194]
MGIGHWARSSQKSKLNNSFLPCTLSPAPLLLPQSPVPSPQSPVPYKELY